MFHFQKMGGGIPAIKYDYETKVETKLNKWLPPPLADIPVDGVLKDRLIGRQIELLQDEFPGLWVLLQLLVREA